MSTTPPSPERLDIQLFVWIIAVVAIGIVACIGGSVGFVFVTGGDEATVVQSLVLLCAAIVWVPGLLLLWGLTQGLSNWQATATVAVVLVAAVGYSLIEALVRGFLGDVGWSVMVIKGGLLLLYAVGAVVWVPRWARTPLLAWRNWWGATGLGLALLLSLVVTIPWPMTGALGDRMASLEIVCRVGLQAVAQAILFWGVIYQVLRDRLPHEWQAGGLTGLVYGLAIWCTFLPAGNGNALGLVFISFPLIVALSELRVRSEKLPAVTVLLFVYLAVPQLFMDPRDAVAMGIPHTQHILAYGMAMGLALVAGVVLGSLRWLAGKMGDGVSFSPQIKPAVVLVGVLFFGIIWTAIYVQGGATGFYDDGFLIILEEQADLSAAQKIPDRLARRQAVYEALKATAERTQAPLRAELEAAGLPYRPYYLINMIRVEGHSWMMGRFEKLPGVAQVIRNPNVRIYPHQSGGSEIMATSATLPELAANLTAIHADDAWESGSTGAGIVIGGQDTGYDWTHPALITHYRGWDGQMADHNYNWHDSWNERPVPFDADGHGTHTMGIMLGDDGRHRLGVAPDAQWIGCRNMRRGFGNPGAYVECMEFFLAPYPLGGDPFTQGDPSRAPDVINNSWGCPEMEGCFPDTLRPGVEALRAAGLMMVVSAGNEGPECSTAITPPANYDAVFSVGAADDMMEIADFSSRGPVGILVKPDVSAPGVHILSAIPGGDYGYADGTSMAGPHVAGLVALLWSADPKLAGDIDGTEALICRTAVRRPVEVSCQAENSYSTDECACGNLFAVPNNVYGCGFIDAGSAVNEALQAP